MEGKQDQNTDTPHLNIDGNRYVGGSNAGINATVLCKIGNNSAVGVGGGVVLDGDREREVGLCMILELDVRHVPRPDLSAINGVDDLKSTMRGTARGCGSMGRLDLQRHRACIAPQ